MPPRLRTTHALDLLTGGHQEETLVFEEVPEEVPEELPTLGEALSVLCAALQGVYVDQQPAWQECVGLPMRAAHGETVLAWRRAIYLLEGILGMPVRGET